MPTKNKVDEETEVTPKGSSATAGKLAPQGSVIEPTPIPGGGFDLRPTAGYDGHYPVQFSDESDQTFAERVAMFEQSFASAVAIEKGGEDLAAAKSALEARHKAELLALEKRFADQEARRTVNGVPVTAPKPVEAKPKGKSKDEE